MINPVSGIDFKADKHTRDKITGNYSDPLMHWPLRGAAFSNEVGEALRPVIGGAATLTWIPALLYIGADVYDKYKNDKTEYSPDSRRCLKQAIFQGLASVLLPVFAVRIGQDTFSLGGRFTKDKISFNTKEQISKLAEQFIANGKMRAFDGRDEECVTEFVNQTLDNLDYKNTKGIKGTVKKIFGFDNSEKVKNYAESTISDLIELRKKLLNPTDEIRTTKPFADYVKALNGGQTENVAVKTALSKFQGRKMLKGKVIKTIGGFIALGSLIKPIDYFVENVLIGKYVEAGFKTYDATFKGNKSNKSKQLNVNS